MLQCLKVRKMTEKVFKIYLIKKNVIYLRSNPGWLIVINEMDFVSGEEMADVQ